MRAHRRQAVFASGVRCDARRVDRERARRRARARAKADARVPGAGRLVPFPSSREATNSGGLRRPRCSTRRTSRPRGRRRGRNRYARERDHSRRLRDRAEDTPGLRPSRAARRDWYLVSRFFVRSNAPCRADPKGNMKRESRVSRFRLETNLSSRSRDRRFRLGSSYAPLHTHTPRVCKTSRRW